MLTAAGSALVSGASPDPTMETPKTTRVKVLRAFLIKSLRQEVGSVIEGMDRRLALELAAANKVELLPPAEAVAPPPPVADDPKPVPAEPQGKTAKKESHHARQ